MILRTLMNSTRILPLVISVSSPSKSIFPDFTSNSIYSSCATPRPTLSKTSKSDAIVKSPLSTTSKTLMYKNKHLKILS